MVVQPGPLDAGWNGDDPFQDHDRYLHHPALKLEEALVDDMDTRQSLMTSAIPIEPSGLILSGASGFRRCLSAWRVARAADAQGAAKGRWVQSWRRKSPHPRGHLCGPGRRQLLLLQDCLDKYYLLPDVASSSSSSPNVATIGRQVGPQ